MKGHGYDDKAMSVKVKRTDAKNLAHSGSVTKAKPGGSAGGYTPTSWQKGNSGKGNRVRSGGQMTSDGWPARDGWIGW